MTSSPISSSEQALVDIAMALAARLDVMATCDAVLDAAERLFDARSSWLLLHDSKTDELVTVGFRGPDAAAYAGVRLPLAHRTIVTIAFAERQPVYVSNVQEEDRWYDVARVRRSDLRTVFTVPLVYEDTAIGVLGLDSRRFAADAPPSPADEARLQALAAQAAIAIRNARMYTEAEDERVRLRRVLDERRQLRTTVDHLRQQIREVHRGPVPTGTSAAFRAVLGQIDLVAPADTTVLLIGETGTGKELAARTIHNESRRRGQAFVAVNCAAIPETLVESELFGYEKGAFTGAQTRRAGKFEMADRGTLLLDEVGDLPADAQAKLLRVVQEREVQRVGSTATVPINVRLIAATNRDLERGLEDGTFRPDLFYRLSVFPIRLPPLRERREDIPLLVMQFLETFSQRQHKPAATLADGLMEQLMNYEWPGNIRELQNVIERAVILATGPTITADLMTLRNTSHLSSVVTSQTSSVAAAAAPAAAEQEHPNVIAFSETERQAILHALQSTGWRISGNSGAADALGLKPTTLHAKMKKLGIRRPLARAVAADST